MGFHEHHSRSLVKTITYRVLIVVSHGATVYIMTHDWQATFDLTIVSSVISTAIYFFHERAWNHVHWGKMHLKKPSKNK
jgi:uncharacterized membrane protein